MFADRARIMVRAGSGGDGAGTFRREAHVPRGGPDGGDGGDGGDVVLVVEPGMTTLGDFKRRRHFRAQDGGRGMGRKAHGRSGADLVVRVPPGTVVRAHPSGEWIGELLEADARLVAARGGRGGRGNVHFASATHRAPKHAEKGTPGEESWIELELKLIADIGLVGAPNAGKSTLLAALTEARPEVGAYPFTTITPNLGVLALDDDRTAVIADVPGLIEGAHEGRGLGHHFLRHVERTRVLVGVVDGAAREPVEEWRAVAEELRLHDPALAERPMPIVVTKLDLAEVAQAWPDVREALRSDGHDPLAVSAHDGTGLDALRARLARALDDAEASAGDRGADEIRVHRFDPFAEGWEVVSEDEAYRVRGRRIETAAARTDFENEESRDRFWRLLEKQGIDVELRRQGAGPGTLVRIGDTELEWGDE
ncbi:MAG TPA: GTPase ObgE [Candidatus Limnocylindrales bacterium]|nr:GTPase ObgE [Candidatus Limnocylindrales bacterium]